MMVLTMHATIMIFFVIIVLLVGTFGNYLIPLKIGAGDMAFPFLNGLAFWSALPAGAIMLAGFFLPGNAASAGWTSYPPLSAILFNGASAIFQSPNFLRPTGSTWPMAPVLMQFAAQSLFVGYICCHYVHLGNQYLNRAVGIVLSLVGGIILTRAVQLISFDGQSCWFFSLFWLGFSSLMGAVNYLTTIIKMRCPGMTMFRLPMTSGPVHHTLLVLLASPVLAARCDAAHGPSPADRLLPPRTGAANVQIQTNSGGGHVICQHLFWFYSHPAVYIMILPAMGMVSDIIADLLPQAALRLQADGLLDRGHRRPRLHRLGPPHVPVRHEPDAGHHLRGRTMMIAVPVAIKTFNWLGTIWGGNIHFTTPMLIALAFVSMFIIGGLSGIFMAATPVDIFIHDTYFIVAHIHYVLFGGDVRDLRRDLLLVPEDVRPDDERAAGEHSLLPHLPVLQRHVLPDAHPGHARVPPANCGLHELRVVPRSARNERVHQHVRVRAGHQSDSVRDQLHWIVDLG